MRSKDLIKKEPLDYGGFGDVYLCYHVTLGQVVLKTIYTGTLRNEDNKKSLLEEGNIMASLNHERVVKLLGVIMEDKDCSLVMELIPRGNLLIMLQTIPVPLSIKGRIILEILEAMVYLSERHIIHKDLKPENILVDKDFHIKIADLGLATCQTWSKLTKEEFRKKSQKGRSMGARGAGTLSYMAPEHLDSIHTVSTEKSDVYSFAIVVWVILTGEEPYANARSEDQICQCVRNGDRPSEDSLPEDTPPEINRLMTWSWNSDPLQRPTFKEGYDFFFPFYTKTLEPHVEKDVSDLLELYEGPEDLVEKMKSLSTHPECFLADSPASLLSSDSSVLVPVEASVEDLHDLQYNVSSDNIETDATAHSITPPLEEKLNQEFEYHKHGSYNLRSELDPANHLRRTASNPAPLSVSTADQAAVMQPQSEGLPNMSSVYSWTKSGTVQPGSQEEAAHQLISGHYPSMCTSTPASSLLPTSTSTPSLTQLNQQHPHSHYNRQKSLPILPVSDTSAPDSSHGRLFTPSKSGFLQDSGSAGSFVIQNASGIQIGNNNTMSVGGHDSQHSLLSMSSNGSTTTHIRECISKYECHTVTEEHLDLLRKNIGANWKHCARRLGLTGVEIETIAHDYYRDGLPEMVYQMLDRWKMKEGSIGCTVGKLYRALEGNIKVDVIQKILESCGSSQ